VTLIEAVSSYSVNGDVISMSSAQLTAVPIMPALIVGLPLCVYVPAEKEMAVPATLAGRSHPSASYCGIFDSVDRMNDGIVAAKSSDSSKPRLSWWDRKGTAEWAQLDLPGKTGSFEDQRLLVR